MTSASGKHLNDALSTALNKRASQSTIRSLTIQPPNAVDFSSNDFLSLATSQELRDLYLAELNRGPSIARLGSGGSRLLDGNSTYAERLEDDIATFHRAKKGLLCNSGFDANVGLFSCLPQPGDAIVYDEFIHASVHDGMRLSRAGERVAFAHNSASALREVLTSLIDTDNAIEAGKRNVFIAVEAVYSMDGDVAPLNAIVDIIRGLLPQGNGHLIVDEAHSNGVLGPRGRGLVCKLGLEDKVSVRLHTFGKALACNGAILLCSPLIRQYLINYARPLIYTTFLSYPSLAAIRASYTYLQTGKTEILTTHLQNLTHTLHTNLQSLLPTLPPSQNPSASSPLITLPTLPPQTPIYSLLTSHPKALALHCQQAGFVVRAIVPPTVPAGKERVRICLHAGNGRGEVESFVRCVGEWVGGMLGEGMQEGERARL